MVRNASLLRTLQKYGFMGQMFYRKPPPWAGVLLSADLTVHEISCLTEKGE
jgi:hypothetical protein